MRNILLVEDEEGIQFANKIILERSGGYSVQLAMNLAEARQIVAQSAPDLIVLDIMLPDGSGLDFLDELRQGGNNVPVLLLTALSETSDELKCIQAGGDDYLPKPYDIRVLVERVNALLRRGSIIPEAVNKGALKLQNFSHQAIFREE